MPAPLKFVFRSLSRCRRSLRPLRTVVVATSVFFAVPQAGAQTLTTDQAVAQAMQQVPGKLVAVSKEQQGDQTVYRVRILGADGVVRTVFIDANP